MLSLLKTIPNNRKYLTLTLVCLAVFLFLALSMATKAQAMEPIQNVLKPGSGDMYDKIASIWKGFLTFVNSIMVVLLLVVAFANILHIQLDNYGIKKILPSLVISIILANFSYFICRFIIDIANMLLVAVINGVDPKIDPDAATKAGGPDATRAGVEKITSIVNLTSGEMLKPKEPTFRTLFWGAYATELGRIVMAIFVAILSYLFFIRNWILYFLVALSPLGFIAMAIPQGKTVFSAWWKNFIQWTFMPVVSAFWLWVGAVFLASNLAGGVGRNMLFVFAMACFYFAITTPFKMGGAIMQQWSNLGKKAWGSTGGAGLNLAKERWVKPAIGDVKSMVGKWYGERILGQVETDAKGDPIKGKKILDEAGEHKKDAQGNLMYETVRKRKKLLDRALGWHYDRSKTLAIDRTDRSERVKALQDQMQGNAMNNWSYEKQMRRRQYVDETGGYLGEIERTDLNQQNEFLQTTAGIKAMQRTYAYRAHVQALKDSIKIRELSMGPKWVHEDEDFFYEKDKDGKPVLKGSGNNMWTRRGIKNLQDTVHSALQSAEMANSKTIGDDEISQTTAAAKLNYSIDTIKTLEKKRKEANKKLLDPALSESVKDEAREDIQNAEGLLELYRGDISEFLQDTMEHYHRISPLLKTMLGDAFDFDESQLDENGERMRTAPRAIANNSQNLKTLGELAGYEWTGERDSANAMVTDRANKIISLADKKELQVESDKRNGVESGHDLHTYKSALEKYYADDLLTSESIQMRNAISRLANLFKTAVSAGDPLQAPANELLWTQIRNLSNYSSLEAVKNLIEQNNTVFGQTLTTALKDKTFLAGMARTLTSAAGNLKLNGSYSIKDEKSLVAAIAEARSSGNSADLAELEKLRDNTITQALLNQAGVRQSVIEGKLKIKLIQDQDGTTTGAEVTSEGVDQLTSTTSEADRARIAGLQEAHAHFATQHTSQPARQATWKNFTGAMKATIDPTAKEFHRRMEGQRKRRLSRLVQQKKGWGGVTHQ